MDPLRSNRSRKSQIHKPFRPGPRARTDKCISRGRQSPRWRPIDGGKRRSCWTGRDVGDSRSRTQSLVTTNIHFSTHECTGSILKAKHTDWGDILIISISRCLEGGPEMLVSLACIDTLAEISAHFTFRSRITILTLAMGLGRRLLF